MSLAGGAHPSRCDAVHFGPNCHVRPIPLDKLAVYRGKKSTKHKDKRAKALKMKGSAGKSEAHLQQQPAAAGGAAS